MRLFCWVWRNEHVEDVAGQVTGHVPRRCGGGAWELCWEWQLSSDCRRPQMASAANPCTSACMSGRISGQVGAPPAHPSPMVTSQLLPWTVSTVQPAGSCTAVHRVLSCLMERRAALARPGFECLPSIISHAIRRLLLLISHAPRHGLHVRNPAGRQPVTRVAPAWSKSRGLFSSCP